MKIFVTAVALLLHQVLGDGQSELASRASNAFSNKLYTEVAKEPGNVLVCPISLHVALAMLHQGADGKTAKQLADVLELHSSSNSIKESFRNLLSGIKDNHLKIATKMFPAAGYQLNESYVKTTQDYFYSDVGGIDYNKPQVAADTINKYVEEKTNNKIHDLISADSITPMTRLIIVNAVHFNANWKIPFPHAYEDDFKVTPTKRARTRMMTVTDHFYFKDLPELQAKMLRMDYEDGDYSMLIVLPNADDGLSAVESKLSSISLTELMRDMKKQKVEVTIPKFKLEQTIPLKDVLIRMGMTEVFSGRADLHMISHGGNLYVSDVIQKTYINVHENGTEAAAATGFLEVLSAQTDRVLFYARRPFHMYLVHRRDSALVLFEGRFVGPFGQNFLEPHEIEDENIHFVMTTERDTKDGNSQGEIHQQNHRPTRPTKLNGIRGSSRPHNSQHTSTFEATDPAVYPGQSNSQNEYNYDRFGSNPQIISTPYPETYYQNRYSNIKPQTSSAPYYGPYNQYNGRK